MQCIYFSITEFIKFNTEYLFILKLIFKLRRDFIVGTVNCTICAIQNTVFLAVSRREATSWTR